MLPEKREEIELEIVYEIKWYLFEVFYYCYHFTNFFKIVELEEIKKKQPASVQQKYHPFLAILKVKWILLNIFWSHIYFTIDGDVSYILLIAK